MAQVFARLTGAFRIPIYTGSVALRSTTVRCGSGIGDPGAGAGKGGGSGGSIRDAGGSFGKMEAAHEEQYFRKLQAEQMKKMKEHLDEEIKHHEAEIKRHKEAIQRHRAKKNDLDD